MIKAELSSTRKALTFPILMIGNTTGTVVLFNSPTSGTVLLNEDSGKEVGAYYSAGLEMCNFSPLEAALPSE